jgi:hypothetical protein
MLEACIGKSKDRIETGQQPALIEVSPEATEASLVKIEANQEEVEAIPNEEMNMDTCTLSRHWKTDMGTGIWL